MRLVPLERITTQTLLGIRFWDRVTDSVVTEGLLVRAQRLSSDRSQRLGKPVMGKATPSGAIAFFGLASGEVPENPDELLWDTTPPEQLVVIDLVDRLSRFLPLSFVARLPFRGVFWGQGDWLNTSLLRPELDDNEEALGVQLWSAPTRPVPPGQTAIRAQIVVGDGVDAPPAANALVRVQTSPTATSEFDYYGLTDSQGMLLLPIPYPAIPDPPPETPYPPLDRQTFALDIAVQYGLLQEFLPESNVPLASLLSQSPADIAVVPNLESLLDQPRANIAVAADPTINFQLSMTVDLQFGRELILRTPSSAVSTAVESVLRIQPR